MDPSIQNYLQDQVNRVIPASVNNVRSEHLELVRKVSFLEQQMFIQEKRHFEDLIRIKQETIDSFTYIVCASTRLASNDRCMLFTYCEWKNGVFCSAITPKD